MKTNNAQIAHELPPRQSRNHAMTALNAAVIRFGQVATEYLANNREGAAPVRVIKAEAGLGKSTATLAEIQKALRENAALRVLYMVPSLDLGEELAGKARALAIEARVLRGRSQPQPGSTATMCAKADIAETLASLSMSVSETLCRKKMDDGTVKECPFAATCPYLAQMAEAKRGGLIIASHQYLSVRMDVLKDVDWVVVDESFWQTLTTERRVDIGRFTSLRVTGEGFKGKRGESRGSFDGRREEANFELGDSVESFRVIVDRAERENRQPTLSDFRERGFTDAHCDYLAGLEYSRITPPDIHPGMDYEEQLDRLQKAQVQEAFAFARIWKILGAELATAREGAPHGLVIERGILNPKSGELGNYIHAFWSRDPRIRDTPTLIIDADADSEIISRFYPGAEWVEIAAEWRHVEIVQCYDKTGSAQSMKGERRRDEAYNAVLDMADRLSQVIEGKTERRPLLVSQKAVIDGYREAGDLQGAPFDTAHFGALRGKDGWKNAAGIVIAGRIEPSPLAVEGMARSIWYSSAEPLTFLAPDDEGRLMLPKCQHWTTAKNGEAREIAVSYHPDDRAHRILTQVREAELMQAIARIRPIHRSAEIPCQVIVLSNVPLPIQPDRFASWAELVPDRFDMARLAGFVPEISGDMADAYPGLFRSAGAVRTAASRRAARAFGTAEGGVTNPIYNHMDGVTGWAVVSYERPCKTGNRAGRAWVRVLAGDTAAKIAARAARFLPDAFDFDVALPSPATPAELPARDDRTGIRWVSVDQVLLAQSNGAELPWWKYIPRSQNIFSHRKLLTSPVLST